MFAETLANMHVYGLTDGWIGWDAITGRMAECCQRRQCIIPPVEKVVIMVEWNGVKHVIGHQKP